MKKAVTLNQLIYRLRGFDNVAKKFLREIFQKNEEDVLDLVRDKQLYYGGVDGRGRSLGKYAKSTIRKKIKKGQIADHVTTRDTGRWHSGFRLSVSGQAIGIYSTRHKNVEIYLKRRYGNELTRLSKENLRIFMDEIVKPQLKRKVKRYVKGSI